MAYDDAAYLAACEQLESAVYALVENDISKADIHDLVDNAVSNA